jgi:hypothetical protein
MLDALVRGDAEPLVLTLIEGEAGTSESGVNGGGTDETLAVVVSGAALLVAVSGAGLADRANRRIGQLTR